MSVLSKPLQKHVDKHLLLHFNKHNLLNPNQSDFRKKHSQETTLTNLVDQRLTNINNDELNVRVIFIDFKKRLRCYWSQPLSLETSSLWNVRLCYELFRSYRNNRQQCVNVGIRKSFLSRLMYGIPQGSLSGPILLPLYIVVVVVALLTSQQ